MFNLEVIIYKETEFKPPKLCLTGNDCFTFSSLFNI